MYCSYYQSHTRQIREKVEKLEKSTKAQNDALAKSLKEAFDAIHKRLDVMELAIIDPHGEAGEILKAKHGKSKPQSLKPPQT